MVKYDVKEKELKALAKESIRQKYVSLSILTTIVIIIITGLINIGIWVSQNMSKKRLLAQQQSLRLKSIIETEQKERKRIARDLHDSLGQSISTLKMQASALQPLAEEASKYEKLLQQMDHVYEELRHISHNIMPNTLITLGLVPAIKELIADVSPEGAPEIQL